MRGILNLAKPSGISSYDAIRRIREVMSPVRPMEPVPIGHAGTLDPLASGVLLILFGAATRLSRFLLGSDKEYEAGLLFGVQTDTDDTTGRTIAEALVPGISSDDLSRLLAGFLGVQDQVPPRFSAIKQNGTVMYRMARKGVPFEVKPRKVTIRELELLDWTPPKAVLRVVVSSGTYIRALARDVGKAAGTVATLSSLTRTRSGRFTIKDALPLDQADPKSIAERLVPICDALPELPRFELSEAQARGLLQGKVVETESGSDAEYALAATPDRKFLCLVAAHGRKLKTLRVIHAD